MSGLELVAALREERKMRDAPILVVSDRAGAHDWRLLNSLGARTFLMKPVSRLVIGAVATELSRGRRARARPNSMFP
jgi:DNA-binding response OmpR family regulator